MSVLPGRRFYSIAALALAVTAGLAARAPGGEPSEVHETIASQKEWLNVSRPLEAKDLAGRIVLLDFWTFCCINCIHVIPDLKALEKEFGGKLTVIGVHSAKFSNEKDTRNIRDAVLRYGLEHPVVNDGDFKLWKGLEVNCWPSLVLVTPRGAIHSRYRGERHLEELRKDVKFLIEQAGDKLVTSALPIALEKDKLPPSPLAFPGKLALSGDGETLYATDSNHHRIVAMKTNGELLFTIGKDEPGTADGDFESARFRQPQGIALAGDVLYVADTENHLLRRVDLGAKKVTTLAGVGKQGFEKKPKRAPAKTTPLSSPWDVVVDADKKRLVVAIAGQHQLWSYDLEGETLDLVAGNGKESIDDGALPDNSLSQPSGLSLLGDRLYFVDSETSSLRVLKGERVATLLGKGLFDFGLVDGARDKARLQHPLGVFADADGVFIADSYNHAIRRFDPRTGKLETLAGDGKPGLVDGPFAKARFAEPAGLVKRGSRLYVADTNNHRIRVLDLEAKTVSTLDVRAAVAKPAREAPDESLPLVEKTAEDVAAAAELSVTIKLPEGFHLNGEAESWLAAWKLADGKWTLVREVTERAALAGPVKLPALAAGEKYRLQASLAYCSSGADAVCVVKAFDRTLTASAEAGGPSTVQLAP